MAAVRELLAEGTFHQSTVEQVADRAGIARATLYQHFRSRLDLVDAICDTFDENPALLAVRRSVELPDPAAALAESIAHAVRFWSSEDAVLRQIYGVVAIDPAARDLVERQRNDRRGEMERLARHVTRAGTRSASAAVRAQALAVLMTLTSYETYRELRELGYGDAKVTRTLQDAARPLLAPRRD
jgi:AcrR family transcriptional regulator